MGYEKEAFMSRGKRGKQNEDIIDFRLSTLADIPQIGSIINDAKHYLKEQGSPQWQNGHEPHEAVIREDIRKKASYVLTLNDEIVGTIALIAEKDPSYEAIEGSWQGNGPYVALHHAAVSQKYRGAGLGKQLLMQAIKQAQILAYQDIRIDTYPKNQAMLHLIEQLGFIYRGMIYFPFEHGERKAFQLI
ncbi:GNAT family N-acetyltransferase [Enterococcus dongliensis]|uniref:GNAT family N-acetyltransferase n=1 Tax=Enterococcus dongliensis TaxID=2559925 RepID=UPI0028908830|nr:GNAT family N-acetyltransferase [Enterococcus dongliensis]MDT2602770.1 GNAT family N-acetyltransferase [Enterococcus dongliensis]MDT2643955.1 GNAT family N-acetyltransferase [Enterococcus dongliensis]MDT2668735.1 GNAT family N-acetyltransferase [Enterococcus dongliensis]MDT2670527.1 GNAT family N-acetyltransferase [Enterococcus dongliensis]MDT2675949.1 GNAT family N-acetyltransferase [Enterococcus dongliensis]